MPIKRGSKTKWASLASPFPEVKCGQQLGLHDCVSGRGLALCVHTRALAYVCVPAYMNVHRGAGVYVCICIHVCLHAYHVHAHMYLQTCVHAAYMHMHGCVCVCEKERRIFPCPAGS